LKIKQEFLKYSSETQQPKVFILGVDDTMVKW